MASGSSKPIKGILKQPKGQATSSSPAASGRSSQPPLIRIVGAGADDDEGEDDGDLAPRLPRTREEAMPIALRHAAIIQQRKDAEAAIFDAVMELVEFPATRAEGVTAANPAPEDAERFKQLIRPFQPTDYDDLIEERNINGLCGYSLCPNPRRRFKDGGVWKTIHKGKKDYAIVKTKDLEMWCGEDCARRALYVKVQLNETAAWERIGLPALEVELYEEQDDAEAEAAVSEKAIARKEAEQSAKVATDLALERGDVGELSGRTMKLVIREKTDVSAPVEPEKDGGESHLLIEGHKPKPTRKEAQQA